MGAQERLLGDLLGLGAVAQHAKRDAEDPMLIRRHQLLERPRLARPQPRQQRGVIRESFTHD
jgi:hypothetical protein